MATIQEALRELKKQRVNESKTKKPLTEDTNSLKKIIRLINKKINDGGLSPEEVQKCVQDKDYMYALLYILSKESQETGVTIYLVMEHNDTGDVTYFGVDGVVNENILDDKTKITISTFYDANDHEPQAYDYTLSQAQTVLEECSGDDFDYTYLDYIDDEETEKEDNDENLDESLFGLGDAVRASMAIKDGKSKRQYLKDRQKENDVFKDTPGKKHLRNMYNFANNGFKPKKSFLDKKDDDLDEALGDEDGDIEVTSFSLPEGKTCENGECDNLNEAAMGDEDGDIEVTSFSLPESLKEDLIVEKVEPENKLTVENIKKDKTYSKLPDKVVKKLIKWSEDEYDAETLEDFLSWIGGYNSLTECAIVNGMDLDATDFYLLVEGDKKFEDVIKKICQIIKWIDKDGYYVDDDGTAKNRKKPSVRELIINFIRFASKEDRAETFDILKKAYIDNNYKGLPQLDVNKLAKALN